MAGGEGEGERSVTLTQRLGYSRRTQPSVAPPSTASPHLFGFGAKPLKKNSKLQPNPIPNPIRPALGGFCRLGLGLGLG